MTTPRAILTGADHPTALGAARGLRAAGARVVGFTARPEGWACRSRAWHEVRTFEASEPAARVEELARAASGMEGPVFVLPTSDEMVEHVSAGREQLPDHARVCLPEHDVVELLLEKTLFFEWAEERGYPIPRSRVLESQAELEAALPTFRFPAILKPLVRTRAWQRASPAKKVLHLRSAEDLGAVGFDLFEVAPSYVLSEWVEGADSDVYYCLVFLDEASEVVASHAGRKLLQYPRLTGSTAICVDHPDPELEALTASLFRDAGCRGLASLEVKRSSADGRFYIMEPTVGRPNLQSYSAIASGVNLYGIALRHTLGEPYADLIGPRRRSMWVEENGFLEDLRGQGGVPIPFGLIAKEAFATHRIRSAYFRFRDPQPAIAMARTLAGNAWRRLWRRRGGGAKPEGR